MQVKSNPRQEGAVNCGLFAGLQAEVLSRHVIGRVREDSSGLVCDGDDPTALQRKDSWFTENDVFAARLLFRAAALAFWTAQSPERDRRVEVAKEEAVGHLQKAWRGNPPRTEELWCDVHYRTATWSKEETHYEVKR